MANIGASRVVPGPTTTSARWPRWWPSLTPCASVPAGRAGVLLVSTGLGGVLHGGNAGVIAATSPDSTPPAPSSCVECGLTELCVVEGEWHAEDALVHRRHPRAPGPRRAGRRRPAAARPAPVAATDGLIALRAGYPTCTLGGGRRHQVPLQLPLALGHPDNLTGRASRVPWRCRSSCAAASGCPARPPCASPAHGRRRGRSGRGARGTRGGSRGGEPAPAQVDSAAPPPPGPSPNSGRSRIPRGLPLVEVVLHGVDQLAHEARRQVHPRDHDTGTSPSSTSWSTRAKVMVNS